jgi:hypothetical protein
MTTLYSAHEYAVMNPRKETAQVAGLLPGVSEPESPLELSKRGRGRFFRTNPAAAQRSSRWYPIFRLRQEHLAVTPAPPASTPSSD